MTASLRAWLQRLLAVQAVDRAAALAGLAFTAIVPFLIVFDAVAPAIERRDFAEGVIARFDLNGVAASAVREALAPPEDVRQSIGVVGAVLVLVSALAFARALQRLYESAFGLPALGGLRGAPATAVWLALIPAAVTLGDAVDVLFDGVAASVLRLACAVAFWTASPFVLLRRRLDWRRLVATGAITAIVFVLLISATALWMTRTVGESAERYGVIGVAFPLLSWLLLAGFALVASAAAGAILTERRAAAITRTG